MAKITSTKAVVTLAVGDQGRQLLALTGDRLKAYANRIGADFHVIGGGPIQPAYPLEDKFRVGQYLDYYERVIYLDADIVVSEDAPDLFALVPDDRLGVCNERPYTTIPLDPRFLSLIGERQPSGYFNTGLMVLGKCHRHLLTPPATAYDPYHTFEQDLINARLLDHGNPVHEFGPDVVWLFFADPAGLHKDRPFQHYAGAGTMGRGHLVEMTGDPVKAYPQKWYLLNLKRRPDRLEDATKELTAAGIPFTRFEAVDGSALPLPANETHGAGAFGCRLSHLRIQGYRTTNP